MLGAGNQKLSNGMNRGRSSAGASAQFGTGWPSNGLQVAPWLGYWVVVGGGGAP